MDNSEQEGRKCPWIRPELVMVDVFEITKENPGVTDDGLGSS